MTAPDSRDSVIVRHNDDGTLDEVFGTGEFHLEQMDTNRWWMQLGPHMVTLSARGKIKAWFGENESQSTLARGPQQAGGEDAKDAARYRWIRQHFKATFHRSTSDYWLIQGEHKTPAAVFRDGMDLTLDTAIDAALNGGQDDA